MASCCAFFFFLILIFNCLFNNLFPPLFFCRKRHEQGEKLNLLPSSRLINFPSTQYSMADDDDNDGGFKISKTRTFFSVLFFLITKMRLNKKLCLLIYFLLCSSSFLFFVFALFVIVKKGTE